MRKIQINSEKQNAAVVQVKAKSSKREALINAFQTKSKIFRRHHSKADAHTFGHPTLCGIIDFNMDWNKQG